MKIFSFLKSRKAKIETPEDYWRKRGATIGEGSHLCGTIMDPSYPFLIQVGRDTTISACRILTHDASTIPFLGYSKCGKVIIGNECFIGADAILLPGTIVGDRVIVGAGTIVMGRLESNGVYVSGNGSIRKICSYDDYVQKQAKLFEINPSFDKHWSNMNWADQQEVLSALQPGKIGFIR